MQRPLLKRAANILILGGLVTGLLSGCFGGDEPTPTPKAAQGNTPTVAVTSLAGNTPTALPTTPVQAEAQATPTGTTGTTGTTSTTDTPAQPLLTLAINSSREADLYQGWPMLVEASLMHPDVMRSDVLAASLTVGDNSKPWTGALTLQVVNAKGEAQSWPLYIADAPTGAVTLDSEAISTVHWWLDPKETAALAEGAYAITAVLNTQNIGKGWQGTIASVPATIRISKAPAKLTPEQESLNAQMLAAQAVVRGDTTLALKELDSLLAKQPDNISVLEFYADLLASQGKTADALDTYNKAIKAFLARNPDTEEAPTILMQKQHDMADRLLDTP